MKRPPETLTPAEVEAIVAEVATKPRTGKRDATMVVVLYCCGLRAKEACDLDIRDFDPKQKTLHVRHGKGDRARKVGIEPLAMKHLTEWIEKRGSHRGPLFPSRSGRTVSPCYFRKLLPEVAVQVGIEKRVHAHGFRHTCAAEMANEGVPIHLIRDVLGHTNVSTTDTYLRQVNPKQVLDAMRARRAG